MLQQAETLLKTIYNKYSNDGVVSIYLWGSILTKDFNEETSDIDAIAFVEDSTPLELQKTIGDELGKSDVPRLHLNFIYLGEFNSSPIKSGLCGVIDPRLLLLDFPYWKHAAGKRLKVKDFSLKKPNHKQAIEIHLQNIKRRQWQDVSKVSPFERIYFIKEIARLIHAVQSSRVASKVPFSYVDILKRANKEEKLVVEAVNELRANNSKISYDRFVPIFQEFIDEKFAI